jgi:hypothetical protein
MIVCRKQNDEVIDAPQGRLPGDHLACRTVADRTNERRKSLD